MNILWNFIQWLHYLALSLWIGGIVFLSAGVAPSVHSSVASRAVAGQIVGKALKRLNMIELGACAFLIVTCFLAFRFVQNKQGWIWILILLVLLMGAITSFYSFQLAPKMEAIKQSVPTLDTLSAEHPSKVEFNHMHQLYVRLMVVNLILGLVVLYGSVVVFK